MKRFVLLLTVWVCLIFICGCSSWTPVVDSLPKYDSKVYYTSGGFQDFTDYAKFSYSSVNIQELEKSEYFVPVTEADVAEILQYLENFENWVTIIGEELENYDFEKTIISDEDYFYIDTKYTDEEHKFWNYTIYYFDVDAQILYYFHNNL